MLIGESISGTGTGIGHVLNRQMSDAGKETLESKAARFRKALEIERKRVQPVRNIQKEIEIGYYEGKHQIEFIKEYKRLIEEYKGKHCDIIIG